MGKDSFDMYLIEKLKERVTIDSNNNETISNKKAHNVLAYLKIPKDLQVTILNDLEKMGYIKRKSKRSIIIK